MYRSTLSALALLLFAGGAMAGESSVDASSDVPGDSFHEQPAEADTAEAGSMSGDENASPSDIPAGTFHKERAEADTAGTGTMSGDGEMGGKSAIPAGTFHKERAEADTVENAMATLGANALLADWDANNDGVIGWSEWEASFEAETANMKDLNGDGEVSASEFSSQLYAHVDADGNGTLEETEITTSFLDTQR